MMIYVRRQGKKQEDYHDAWSQGNINVLNIIDYDLGDTLRPTAVHQSRNQVYTFYNLYNVEGPEGVGGPGTFGGPLIGKMN